MEFILFIAVIVLLIWVASLSNRIGSLESRFRPGPAVMPAAQPQHSQPIGVAYSQELSDHRIFHNQQPASAMPMPMPEPPKEIVKPVRSEAEDAESAVNWLNKIGVVALVLGLGFFLKIAIDYGWIGPWMQIVIGLAIGGLLIFLGDLWKNRFGEKALALTGGGIAILYFSIYAAFNFYHLVPDVAAFLSMVAVAAFAVWLSFRNSSLALGLLAFFGAFGAPLLFNPGQDQQVMLFAYLTIINISALGVMFKKYWNQLLVLTLVGTIIDFGVWGSNFSNIHNTFPSLTFVIITAVVYAIGSAVLVRLHNGKKTLPADFENNLGALMVITGLFYFISIYGLLSVQYYDLLPAIGLLGSVIFFFAYALADRLNFRNLNYCVSFAASALLVFAAIWKFDGKALAAVLLVLGLLGSSVGTMVKREELRVWGILVLFMSLFKSLFEPYGPGDNTFLFNAKFGLMFANTLAMLFVGWLYQKIEASPAEKNVEKFLQIAAALVLWGAVSWDIVSPFHIANNADNFMSLWWVIFPVALAAAAFWAKRKELFTVAVLMLCASFLKVLFLPYTGQYFFLYNIKFGLMALETAALLAVAWIAEKRDGSNQFSDALKVGASLLLWFAVSWEIVKYFENALSQNTRNLYLSLWWIAYSAVLMGAGIVWRSALFRKIAIALFFVTIVKVFLFDLLSLDLGYLIVSFISLGVILITVSFVYRKHKEQITKFLNEEKHVDIAS